MMKNYSFKGDAAFQKCLDKKHTFELNGFTLKIERCMTCGRKNYV